MGTEPRPSRPGLVSDDTTVPTPASDAVRSEAHLRAGSLAGLRSLRTGLGHCLEHGAYGPETIADAQLVLAEIATNAFVHDSAPLVDVQVVCRDDEIEIGTWHRGEIPPPPYPVQPVPIVGPVVLPSGRGLAIVDRIVVSRVVASDSGVTTTVVRIRR